MNTKEIGRNICLACNMQPLPGNDAVWAKMKIFDLGQVSLEPVKYYDFFMTGNQTAKRSWS